MQKTIYRVRTKGHVSGRICTDMLREARALTRAAASRTLHIARANVRAGLGRARRKRKAA